MDIILTNDQQKVYQETQDVFQYSKSAINNSVMGAGKTYVSAKLGLDYHKMIIICPASVESVWQNISRRYNLKIITISYESLTSITGKQPKHGYLHRIDNEDNEETFIVTREFKKLVMKKILLIADESHRLKNDNTRTHAFKSLCQYINRKNTESRILLLSGTPFTDKKNVINMLLMLGIISNEKLINYIKEENRYEMLGAQELINYCNSLDNEKTREIRNRFDIDKKNVIDFCYQLYVNVIQPKIVRSMPSPKIEVPINCYNGYFHMSEKGAIRLKNAISSLKNCFSKDKKEALKSAEKRIQTEKVEIFVRLARIILNTRPQAKVALFFDFDQPISESAEQLEEFNPIVITGKTHKTTRQDYIDLFQNRNMRHRLIIFNMAVGCEGFDLDSKYENEERWAFAAPNYHIIRMQQMSGRFYRVGTKTSPNICMVYGICGIDETSILNSIARKTSIMKETLPHQVNDGIFFPGDYCRKQEISYSNNRYEIRDMVFEKLEIDEQNSTYNKKKKKILNSISETLVLKSNVTSSVKVTDLLDF